jgi:hypothetical protein
MEKYKASSKQAGSLKGIVDWPSGWHDALYVCLMEE